MVTDYLTRCYKTAGIPATYCTLNTATLDLTRPSAIAAQAHAAHWKNGTKPERGLILGGSQGTGKSTWMWLIARAFVKANAIANGEDKSGTLVTNIFARKFPRFIRDEFAPQPGQTQWNFQFLGTALQADAIFLDDLTLDPSRDTFRPVSEFLFLLIDELSDNCDPPIPLYITTNNTAEDWRRLLGAQLVDRLVGTEHGLCEIVACNWKSYR